MKRSNWGSRIGFILAAAGSAVGLGSVWKFPYVTGNNGGGVFLLTYLVACLTLGVGLMTTEIALGRAGATDAVGLFRKLRSGTAWPLVGYAAVLACFLILSFYCTIGGWTVAYVAKSLSGSLNTSDVVTLRNEFSAFSSDAFAPLLALFAFSGMTLGVVLGGVQKGIEMLSKILLPMLLFLMLALIVRGLMLPGALAGVVYYLKPDFSKFSMKMVVDAMGLAFFSLSLGMGIMLTYGSYVERGVNLFRSSLWVISLTLCTSFLAGLMVLPAVFAFGFSPQEGPGLTFVTMPAVFAQMPAGALCAVAFFVLLLAAALTSSVSLLEVIASFLIDEFGWSRRRAATLATLGFLILGVFTTLAFGPLAHWTLFGKDLFLLLDFITSNLLMPLVEIAVALFAGWVAWPHVETELRNGGAASWWLTPMRTFLRFVAPVLIAVVLANGLL